MLIRLPHGLDLDLLADAFLNFATSLFDDTDPDAFPEIFTWSEVPEDLFDHTCSDLVNSTPAALIQAVWTQGRLAIVSPPGRLTALLRAELVNDLAASQIGSRSLADEWEIIHPAAPALPIADRRQPVAPTSGQMSFLHLCALQEDGQHPAVAMPPIYLTSPKAKAFEAAFETLQERYEILHMSFARTPEQTYLLLHDELALPFSTKRYYRPGQNIARLAARMEATIAARLSTTGPLWEAVLVQNGAQAALVCVLSETIADPHTTLLLRAEIQRLYDWFKEGPNIEPAFENAQVQFLDFAAAQQETSNALAWWESLAIPALPPRQDTITECAPVAVWDVGFPAGLDVHLRERQADLRSLFFHAFLKSLGQADGPRADWGLVRSYAQRPAHASDVMGQFCLDVPLWLGDLPEASGPDATGARLTSTLRHGVISAQDLSGALRGKVPRRIPYLFDWRPQKPMSCGVALPQDITLRVWMDGPVPKAQWAIRRDHPLSRKEKTLRAIFEKEATNVLKLDLPKI